MAQSYTNRGSQWEWLSSWWILLTFLPFGITSFIAFLYAGYKVKNRKWKIIGVVYLLVFIIAFSQSDTGTGAFVAFFSWIIAIIHAFIIRPAFVIQLDVLKEQQPLLEQEKIAKLRKEAKRRFAKGDGPDVPSVITQEKKQVEKRIIQNKMPGTGSSTKTTELNQKPQLKTDLAQTPKININTATEQEIASIPEIGYILAKRVVDKRQELGGFDSFEQLSQIIGLKEHTQEKIKQRLEFTKPNGGVDKPKSGRLVDF